MYNTHKQLTSNATQRNTTQRNTTQRNASDRGLRRLRRHSRESRQMSKVSPNFQTLFALPRKSLNVKC